MNMQQVAQPRSSNEYGRRKVERDSAIKFDSKFLTGEANSNRTGLGTGLESHSRDRLVYITACLIGHQVEVQLLDGSVFSGIFHATNADNFGIVLKMAHLIKDGSNRQKNIADSSSKPPSKTLIIPSKDLVQVIAKGVPITTDGLTNELQIEKQTELMTDSFISHSRKVDVGRELERWVPDEDDPVCPELERVFDAPWNRGWDQFEANETLFGVKSTFDEELYTTKLARGPKLRELEREATRMAREIEGEDTLDLHLAEERGIQIDANLEIDEETRFSSVDRGVDDSGYDEVEDILLDSVNDETFGSVSDSASGKPTIESSKSSLMNENVYNLSPEERALQMLAEQLPEQSLVIEASRVHDSQFIEHFDGNYVKEEMEKHKASACKDGQHFVVKSIADMRSFPSLKKEVSDNVGLSPNATSFDPSHASSKGHDRGGAASTSASRGLSPSSSVGLLASEKSTLNPHAKEFKFNPKAKSFTPLKTPLRPSPVADGPFYYPANMTTLTHMHGMPGSIGIGPSFALQQPIIFNPQAAQMPQPYYHPNGPQYEQQMISGQPRPVMYMPTYPPEMPYKGREF